MKNQKTTFFTAGRMEALQARYALRVAARLSENALDLPHDVTERLRVARQNALERARLVRKTQTASDVQVVGVGPAASSALRGPASSPAWLKFVSILPVVALVGGFLLIERAHVRSQISAAAEIDAALLADDVPPAAYSDPGFVEFLKTPRD